MLNVSPSPPVNGLVIMYADKITRSMQLTIDETNRRREKQIKHNTDNGLIPTPLKKKKENLITQKLNPYAIKNELSIAAEDAADYSNPKTLKKAIKDTKAQMVRAAQELDFLEAARLRDKLFELQQKK